MGMTDLQEAKRRLRSQIRRLKREKTPHDLAAQSRQIAERLLSHPRVLASNIIMAYHSLPDEVNTRKLLDHLLSSGKIVLLPQVTGTSTMCLRRYAGPWSVEEGAYGILEPVGTLFTDYEKVEVVIVPGMAFDRAGYRLGRGKGYYDRFLPLLPNAYKIGVCYDFQLRERVPHEEYDVVMDEVMWEDLFI
jgi:5-formyltetrahydrofolate cyclo-ligase